MTSAMLLKVGSMVALLVAVEGCASLTPPFDAMKGQPMTVYRLQNYEVAPAPAGTPPATGVPSLIPPQLAQLAQQYASLLPPGLIPPGILPGAPAVTPAPSDVPRFHDFRILGYQQITDVGAQNDVLKTFGSASSFSSKYENCFFPEFGFAIAQPNGQPPADILVSLSCQQVKSFNITWPYPNIGLTAETQKTIANIVSKAFGS
jgi:hypothetical protein